MCWGDEAVAEMKGAVTAKQKPVHHGLTDPCLGGGNVSSKARHEVTNRNCVSLVVDPHIQREEYGSGVSCV